MKTTYIQPEIEIVRIRLISNVLDDTNTGFYGGSKESEWGQAAETKSGQFDTEEDIWADRQMKDVWER